MFIPKIVGALALLDKRVPTDYNVAVSIPPAQFSATLAPLPPPASSSVTLAPPPPPPTTTVSIPPPVTPTIAPPALTNLPPPPSPTDVPSNPQPDHPAPELSNPGCANPRRRREWRYFSNSEKQSYIAAVQCLKKLPPKGKDMFPAVTSRFDDFLVTHYSKTFDKFDWEGSQHFFGDSDIHQNGLFLPWHRYFLWLYESALVNECGYSGAQPFWDMSLDVPQNGAIFANAPVFDEVNGFGGNGGGDGMCLSNGPFASAGATLEPGPPTDGVIHGSNRCFRRNLNPEFTNDALGWDKNVMPLLNTNSYQDLAFGFDANQDRSSSQKFGIHVAGHMGIGGEMSDTMVSPTDPLFYLHHANLDRIWWMWQNKAATNVYAIGWKIFYKKSGREVDMTLDTTIEMYPFLAPNVPARQVMDPMNRDGQGAICYVYEKGGFDVPWTVAGQ